MSAIVFGRRPRGVVTAWYESVASGTWAEIPGGTLADADPDPGRVEAWAGSGGQATIVTAWGSAWTDPNGVQYCYGGGHSDYYGNELYTRDLSAASPAWSRVSEPSDLASYSNATGTDTAYSDGRIRSTHVYNAAVWAPGTGPVMAGLSSRSTDGGHGSSALFTFNTSTGAATASSTETGDGAGTGFAACYDSTRGTSGSIWMRRVGTSSIYRHDIAADTRSAVGSAQAWSGQCSLAAHSSGDYLLVGNGDPDQGQTVSGGWCVFDCTDGTYYTPTFTGTVSGGLWPGFCQPVWVASIGKFCAWDNDTDRTRITTLTPGADPLVDDWTISYLTVSGSNTVTPSAAAANGTYGRFAYWSAAGGFVVFNSAAEAGYFFKV